MFRLPEADALINRMGFNNEGLSPSFAEFAAAAMAASWALTLGRTRPLPAERAGDDYTRALQAVHRHADYVTVNLSSPNTRGCGICSRGGLAQLLEALGRTREALADEQGRRTPLLIKIAPDLHDDDLKGLAAQAAAKALMG